MSDLSSIVTQNYINLIQSLTNAGNSSASQLSSILAQYGLTPTDLYTYVGTQQARDLGLYRFINADESVRFYGFANPQGLLNPGEFDDIAQGINSNLGQATHAAKSTFTSVISANTALNALDFVLTNGTVKKYTPETPLQETLAFAAKISPPVQIASVACRLGKAIDGGIYDLARAIGLNPPESLNPETWEGIVSNDTVFGQAFNWLLALDSEEKATCYADAESVAYCAQWLNNEGFFNSGDKEIVVDNPTVRYNNTTYTVNKPPVYQVPSFKGKYTAGSTPETSETNHSANVSGDVLTFCITYSSRVEWHFCSKNPFTVSSTLNSADPVTIQSTDSAIVINGQSYDVSFVVTNSYNTNFRGSTQLPTQQVAGTSTTPNDLLSPQGSVTLYYYILLYQSELIDNPAIEGIISNGGVIPDTSAWTDTDATLQSLQTQYPDWFNDQLQVETVQPDGTTKQYTYVPVAPVSDINELGNIDTQAMPATDVLIDPETATLTQLQTLIEALTQSLLKPQEAVNPELELELNPQIELPNGSNQTNPEQPNKNPENIGSGLVPPIVLPTGDASSLWAVYHPTQSQLNAFGAWLWSSDFVEQIKRLFNDPMQAVIGVHKVFAPIPTGGSSTIKCGYLDSGVSSATVSSQYTEVNCGTVDCREYFGNVFDYDPHTKVSIYLPFIGVVPLKVSEVMRASINVIYGVDVITGACLAKVKVTRDGGGGILYSYGGSCACHYPISSGSYAGIISGIVTSAIGIAGGIVTGNPLSAVGGAMAGLHQAHTEVQRSGGFTGCAGAMGPKIPYLIIDRPQTRLAADFEAYQGKPSNSTQFIGDCSGFVRATEVHFSAPGVFDEEAREVESLLKAGVKLD